MTASHDSAHVDVAQVSDSADKESARRRQFPGGALLWVLIGLMIVGAIATQGILIRPTNLATVLFQSSVIGILALGQAFVVIGRGLDLSLGANAILCAIVVGSASATADSRGGSNFMPPLPLAVAILVGLILGCLIGCVNGFLAGRIPVPPFIITLATYLVLVGVTFLLTGAAPVNNPDPIIIEFGEGRIGILPYSVVVWFVCVAVVYWLLNRTKYGEMLYAVGGNETVARLSGIRIPRVKVFAYAVAGTLAAVAGMMFLARIGTVLPSDGGSFMLDSIAAIAVGGISLTGGVGRVRDVVYGVLIVAVAGNLMNLLGVSVYIIAAVQGLIILVAVGVNVRLSKGRQGT